MAIKVDAVSVEWIEQVITTTGLLCSTAVLPSASLASFRGSWSLA